MKHFMILSGVLLMLLNSCTPSNQLTSSKETNGNNGSNSSTTVPVIALPIAASANLNTAVGTLQSTSVNTSVSGSTPAIVTVQLSTSATNSSNSKQVSVNTAVSANNSLTNKNTLLSSSSVKDTAVATQSKRSRTDSVYLEAALGKKYFYGHHMDMNVVKAKTYYKRASKDSSSARAMYQLGLIYLKEIGTNRNLKAAFNLFKQAADLNYAPAMVRLAYMYHKGEYVTQDFTKAFQLYKQAADLNNKSGVYWTGYMYYKGLGTVQDYSKAIEYLRQDSVQGERRAIYLLGYCNMKAYGMPQNFNKAKECFTIAFKKGEEQVEYLALHHTIDSIKHHPNPNPSVLTDVQNNRLGTGVMSVSGNTASADLLQGVWTGKLYIYDWSRTVIESVQDMSLDLHPDGSKLSGTWNEGGKQLMKFIASPSNDSWKVEQASSDNDKSFHFKLDTFSCQVNHLHDFIYITGNLERISKEENEPKRPSFFILNKETNGINQTEQDTTFVMNRVYPNPMGNELHIDFTVKKTDDITFQVQNQAGVAYLSTNPQNYHPGVYSTTIYSSLPTGSYNLVAYGKEYKLTKIIIKK
jgi:TPR repeat protein